MARDRIDELDERISDMRRARDELVRLLERSLADSDGDYYCQLIEHRTTDRTAQDQR